MCPWNVWDNHIVAIIGLVGVIFIVTRLPQNTSFLEMKVDVAPHHQMCDDVSASVLAVATWYNDLSASLFGRFVNRSLKASCVVGETITFRSELQYVEFLVGKTERIGVFTEIVPVLYIEVRSYFLV